MQRSCNFVAIICLLSSCTTGESEASTVVASLSAKADEVDSDQVKWYETDGKSVYIECRNGSCEQGARSAFSNREGSARVPKGVSKIVQMQVDTDPMPWKQEVVDAAEGEGSGYEQEESLQFKVWLWEEDWSFDELRSKRRDPIARERIVSERKAFLEASQTECAELVESLGGTVVARRWLTNSLLVSVPRRNVQQLLEFPGVFSAYLPGPVQPTDAGDGYERRKAFSPAISISETGLISPTDRVVIGVIESANNGDGTPNTLNVAHFGWRDVPLVATTRILSTLQCGTSSCGTGGAGSVVTHGTVVSSIAAGSIEEGQDPSYPGSHTSLQQRRSSVATEAYIRYYRPTGGSDHIETAIERATSDGVDVINISFLISAGGCSGHCDNAYDPSGIRADLRAAEDAGVLSIVSAGNDHPSCGPCSVAFPATEPDVIAVGALADTLGIGQGLAGPAAYSGRGMIPATLFGGASGRVPVIGLMTFGTVRLTFNGGVNGYSPLIDSGASISAPQVTSLAALFRQYMLSNSIALSEYAWCIGVNTLLMGDTQMAPYFVTHNSVNDTYGYGFPRYFVPNSTRLGAYGGWGTRNDTIDDGEILRWEVGGPGPESDGVNGWKLALVVDPTTTSSPPDLDVRVEDLCPTGGGGPVTIDVANHLEANRYRLAISDPNVIRGHCLRVQVTGTHVKPGGANFWAADFLFSSTQINHLYVP